MLEKRVQNVMMDNWSVNSPARCVNSANLTWKNNKLQGALSGMK